jgi:hypothetical protein
MGNCFKGRLGITCPKGQVKALNNVFINELSQVPLQNRSLEITERKGLGHPDTMCDNIMNQISVDLSKEYMKGSGTSTTTTWTRAHRRQKH